MPREKPPRLTPEEKRHQRRMERYQKLQTQAAQELVRLQSIALYRPVDPPGIRTYHDAPPASKEKPVQEHREYIQWAYDELDKTGGKWTPAIARGYKAKCAEDGVPLDTQRQEDDHKYNRTREWRKLRKERQ